MTKICNDMVYKSDESSLRNLKSPRELKRVKSSLLILGAHLIILSIFLKISVTVSSNFGIHHLQHFLMFWLLFFDSLARVLNSINAYLHLVFQGSLLTRTRRMLGLNFFICLIFFLAKVFFIVLFYSNNLHLHKQYFYPLSQLPKALNPPIKP